jgi:hypothetical protein
VHELHVLDIVALNLLQLLSSQASPLLEQRNSLVERVGLWRHRVDSPESSCLFEDDKLDETFLILLFLNVKRMFFPRAHLLEVKKLSACVECLSLVPCILTDFKGWHLNLSDASDCPKEFLFDDSHGLSELVVLREVIWSIPWGV